MCEGECCFVDSLWRVVWVDCQCVDLGIHGIDLNVYTM